MTQHILVVDDEADIRQLTALVLKTAGYEVTHVRNGVEAMAEVQQRPYDLVILDIMMPEMDGWEACRQIKRQPGMENIPVMFLTARCQPLDRVIGLEVVHADAYLTKPFSRRALITQVEHLIAATTDQTPESPR